MTSDEFKAVIHADRTPSGEHDGRFNAPTANEIAIVMVGSECTYRDIVIHRRNNTVIRICETHRSYDALQYPLIFWNGCDGYHLNYRQVNPNTGIETAKKISAMSFYCYRFMIRPSESNYILRFRHPANTVMSNEHQIDILPRILEYPFFLKRTSI